jgi:hypothetical protein
MTNSRCGEIRRLVSYSYGEAAEMASVETEGGQMNAKCLMAEHDPYSPAGATGDAMNKVAAGVLGADIDVFREQVMPAYRDAFGGE